VGRKCLCNALVANIGLPQVRNGKHVEQPLITSGDDLKFVTQFLTQGQLSYSAEDVVTKLLGTVESARPLMNEVAVGK
jgi:nitronate monooxygenase